MVALYTFTALLTLSSSAVALPRPYIFNSKSVQAPAAIKAVASPSSVESFWVAAGADYFLPSDLAASSSAAAAPSVIQDDDTSLPYGRSTPAASPTYPSFPSITPAPTAFPTTNSSATLFAELSSLISRGLLDPHSLDAQTRSRLSKRDGLSLLDLYLSLVSSRSENGVLPTPWTPAQIRRQSLAEERERSSSSSRAAASSRSAASASAKTTTTTRTYHADGSASRTTTTTRRTSTSTSSVAPAATQTCRVTADCNNTPPANANKYCNDGVCSFRCRTGFVLSSFSGSCMVAPSSSSSSSSSTTLRTTTTSRTTTTTTSRTTTPSRTTTTTTAPAATQTCALTADCSNSIPGNANRYCDEGVCGFRCRDGFTLSSSGSSCIAEPATTTTTTAAPAPTQTCKVTADCETSPLSLLPANANRYCDEGVCSFRCRSGFLLLGTLCISSTSASASASPTSTGASWTQNPSFTTLSEFTSSVVDKSSYSWGGDLIDVVPEGPPAGNWTNGEVVSEGNGPALKVAYPAGSRNPSSAIKGGVGFYSSKLDISQATNVSFSYSVFFPTGFNFVKGGKLPGLFGGKKACSGGSTAEDCFSMRLMFRTGGMGELYLYAPREKQPESLCTLGPLSYCNSVYGMSIGRGSWTFKTGEWTDLRQDIWLNTPGKADGGFNIWVNGQLVLHSSTVYYRNGPAGNVVVGPGNSTELVLIDYDNLPEGVQIPNGGFKQHPNSTTGGGEGVFQPSFVTKVILPTPTATATSTATEDAEPTSMAWDAELKRARKARRTLALPAPTATSLPAKAGLEKRATATVASGFVGAMCQTFFGGSDASWNSPVLQYSYFKGFGMRINP